MDKDAPSPAIVMRTDNTGRRETEGVEHGLGWHLEREYYKPKRLGYVVGVRSKKRTDRAGRRETEGVKLGRGWHEGTS